MQHFQVLEFDLHKALLGELIALFEKMRSVDLTEKNAIEVEDGQGVYQLFFRGELV